MRHDIVEFVKTVCKRYKLEAYYMPDGDTYVVTRKGRAIQNFNTRQFYEITKIQRMKDYIGLIMGLNHNLGEKHKEQLYLRRNYGIKII